MVKNLGIRYKRPTGIKAFFLGNEVAEVREFESDGTVRIIMAGTGNVFSVPWHMVQVRVA